MGKNGSLGPTVMRTGKELKAWLDEQRSSKQATLETFGIQVHTHILPVFWSLTRLVLNVAGYYLLEPVSIKEDITRVYLIEIKELA